MSDRIKDPKTKLINQLPDVVRSDVGVEYPVDMLKEAFTKTDLSIKSFCRRFGLNKSLIEKYIRAGNWDQLKEQFRERMFNVLASEREDLLERKQSIVQRAEMFKLLELEQQMGDLEAHFLKYGDFFVRTEDEEIARDSFGNPLSKRVGLSKSDLNFLREIEAIREVNRKLLKDNEQDRLTQLEAGKKDTQIIDVEDYFNEE